MKKSKHFICLILVLSFMLSMVPMVFAASSFPDVADNAWYAPNVQYVYDNGLMNGMDGGFNPEGTLTRAMLVTVLHRIEGEPIAPDTSFTDVAGNAWFYGAVAWAHNIGIVNGRTDTTFEPNAPITRQEVATILLRYTQSYGYEGVSGKGDLSGFSDLDKVAGWALDAMDWAVANGLINGSDGKLLPEGNATRAQIAAILNRFCENVMGDHFQTESDRAMAGYAEAAMAYRKERGSDSRFGLIYIDADQIPELVCIPGSYHLAQATVYTWYNGEVYKMASEYGMYGTLPYAPRENAFGDYSKPMKIWQGMAWDTEYDTSKFVEFGFGDMHKITQANVDKILLGK